MPATPASDHKKGGTDTTPKPSKATSGENSRLDENAIIRLHVTPFTPALLKVYLAPSVLPLARNISYHSVETFPEKGFGYLELPAMEATKLKKKLNGSTLKGSKVRIEEAKPEKRKAADELQSEEKMIKRSRKEKERKKKDQGVIEGVELPSDRKIKRGWTEPATKNRKERKEKEKDKKDKKDKKPKQKESKYTKEPEMLFKAKLTPVAATEAALKDKSKGKKDKKSKKSKSKEETIVHEFENNSKQPSFLKATEVVTETKPAVEYINGKGWVDEDGNIVEAETAKARNRRVLELVDVPPAEKSTLEKKNTKQPAALAPESSVSSKLKSAQKEKRIKKQATPSPSSSDLDEESSVVSSSSESEASESESEAEPDMKSSPSPSKPAERTPEISVTPSSPVESRTEVHPLEALFKRSKPSATSPSDSAPDPTSTPAKGLAPINTSFSFFGNDEDTEQDAEALGNPPVTPFTQRDLDWRGLRSAAPTPDTAAIGRRFSFPWRKGSHEANDDEEDDDDDDPLAGRELSNNTKANSAFASHLPGLTEEDESEDLQANAAEDLDEDNADIDTMSLGGRKGKQNAQEGEDEEKEESEFAKWFWENRGDNNRAWKKRRRESLKAKRLRDNKRLKRSG